MITIDPIKAAKLGAKVISKLSLVRYFEEVGALDPFMAYLASDPIIKLKWEAATSLDISDHLVIDAGAALGFTAGQVQELFNLLDSRFGG